MGNDGKYKSSDMADVTMVMEFQGDCEKALDAYQTVFGAQIIGGKHHGPEGKITHAMLKIGDTHIMTSDDHAFIWPGKFKANPHQARAYVYVPSCDETFAKAVNAGFAAVAECKDQFWGDRMGIVIDPFGHQWTLATAKQFEKFDDDEFKQGQEEWFKEMASRPTAS